MVNKTLPILLKNQKILLIGGGKVALQKAQVLRENEIEFSVVADICLDDMYSLCENITIKKFKTKDIKDYYIIIDATGNMKVTNKLLKYKKSHDILLNVVDVPALCDFYFMALTKNRPLQIAVSSNGASPTAAQFFRDECESMIPDDITKYLESKQKERDNGIIDINQTSQELKIKKAKVYLVGCGLGDVELLTIKAYKTIQKVDVILYDHLISQEILDVIPKNTKQIYVGKQKDFHSKTQEEINELIFKYASKGLQVARLKSGDPFVFGRGAEELADMVDHGIECEVIAGISSSISGCSQALIPITARGYAAGFTVVSAHLKGNNINLEWIDILKKSNHTVVVLMGLSRAREISECAIKLGVDKDKPCAIISNASRENQSVVQTTIENLYRDSIGVERPAIIVFGDVVNYMKNLKGDTNDNLTKCA